MVLRRFGLDRFHCIKKYYWISKTIQSSLFLINHIQQYREDIHYKMDINIYTTERDRGVK